MAQDENTNELMGVLPQKTPCIVYVLIDDESRILSIDSSEFIKDTTGWIEIDSGYGDKYRHAQGNYFPMPLRDDRGIYRYKLVGGEPAERTQEEMDADYVEPEVVPSDKERITALEEELKAAKILLGLEV